LEWGWIGKVFFGVTEAASAGFITLLILSGVGMILSWATRSWSVYSKMFLVVFSLNFVNTGSIGYLGVIPVSEYLQVILPSSLPINILLSFFILWIVKDLSDEYVYKTQLINSARKDPLTQLYNRRAFMHYYELYTTKKKDVLPLSVAFIDIDHFKNVNDAYGHIVGDVVLQKVSSLIKNNLRSIDIISRYGGEEFVVILPFCNEEDARQIMERIRYTTETHPIVVEDLNINITLSVGIATSPVIEAKKLLEEADSALYAAKENGRNQVESAKKANIVSSMVAYN
jgi:diguanylate cyclase